MGNLIGSLSDLGLANLQSWLNQYFLKHKINWKVTLEYLIIVHLCLESFPSHVEQSIWYQNSPPFQLVCIEVQYDVVKLIFNGFGINLNALKWREWLLIQMYSRVFSLGFFDLVFQVHLAVYRPCKTFVIYYFFIEKNTMGVLGSVFRTERGCL